MFQDKTPQPIDSQIDAAVKQIEILINTRVESLVRERIGKVEQQIRDDAMRIISLAPDKIPFGDNKAQDFLDGSLTAIDYTGSQYYEEHRVAGLDYLGHGYWQASYAKMVTDATLQSTYPDATFFDAGCACGSIMKAFKDTGIFQQIMGIDLSEHMVKLGRSHFGFTHDEIQFGSIDNIPLPNNSITLLHSTQVLEHIPDNKTDAILAEFARILRPGGRAFLALDAIRHGETKEQYMGDPTHFNIQPVAYWTRKLQNFGLIFDIEAYNRFVHSEQGPTHGDPRSFYQRYPGWSVWTLWKA